MKLCVCFRKNNNTYTGSSVMTDKDYYNYISRVRARLFRGQAHRYRGRFKKCTITEDGMLEGVFENEPSSGEVHFYFPMRKKWATVRDSLSF